MKGAFLLDYSQPDGALLSLFSEKARHPVWAPRAANLVALGVHEAAGSSGLAPPSADGRSAFVYIDEAGDLVLQRVSAKGLETATVLWRPRNLELSETLEWQHGARSARRALRAPG